MKTMKKIYKRILTLVLAVSLTLSCPVVASAAELDESSVTGDEMAVVFVSDDGIIDVVPIGEDGTIEYVVSDSADSTDSVAVDYLINQTYTNQNLNQQQSITRTMPYDGYIVVKLVVTGSATIKVNIRNILWATLYEDSVTNGTSWKKSNSPLDQNWKVDITVTCKQNGTDYTLQAWVE